MYDYLKKLITPDMVFFGVPSGPSTAIDLTGKNPSIQCFGTHPNVPVIAPPIEQINACDATTDWTGTVLSIDTSDKKEGTGSLKDAIASPSSPTYYHTVYNPTGSWDWSDKEYILLWFYCDRASNAFTSRYFYIEDTSGSFRWWSVTFSAGWTAFKLLLSTGSGESGTPPNLASINIFRASLFTADTTTFYKKIDDLRVTAKPSLINPSVGWVFGGDDKIVIPNNPSTNFGLGSFSLGAWANRNVFSSTGGIISKEDGTNKYRYLLADGGSDNYVYTLIMSGENSVAVDKPLTWGGEWHRIIMVVDRDNDLMHTFADGIEIGTATDISSVTGVIDPVRTLQIGQRHAGSSQYLNGYGALPFLVKGAWSPARVKNDHLQTKGMFAPRG